MPVVAGELDLAARELRSVKLAVRRAVRAVGQAQDTARTGGRALGRYELAACERFNSSEVLYFLHLAVGANQEGVVITVSQPARAQTTREVSDGEDV